MCGGADFYVSVCLTHNASIRTPPSHSAHSIDPVPCYAVVVHESIYENDLIHLIVLECMLNGSQLLTQS